MIAPGVLALGRSPGCIRYGSFPHGWDGTPYDCDFNQMLERPVNHGLPSHIRDFDASPFARREIRTGAHCLGCTAGSGSSRLGSLA